VKYKPLNCRLHRRLRSLSIEFRLTEFGSGCGHQKRGQCKGQPPRRGEAKPA
jgi:hypothetical protein